MNIPMITVPKANGRYSTFKIRTKQDVKDFLEKAMPNNSEHCYVVDEETTYVIRKSDNEISILIKRGNLNDIFNPLLEIANTNNSAYDVSVYDVVWKIRKTINDKWFND